ncbi:alanine racemase [Thiospirillum jenense]|uniref:alanine racemase n=1 Tax=Thiospirillum jenense TaxID=1653858 RepID=UPI0030B80154
MNQYAPTARINLAALRHNFNQVRLHAPASRVYSVIKANAYGHDLETVAAVLAANKTDGFAVARLDEALRLRHAGIAQPILVLEGANDGEDVTVAYQHHLTLVVHQTEQFDLIEHSTTPSHYAPLNVWLKVDTGMHRLGLATAQVPELLDRLNRHRDRACLCGLLTHLANADDPDDPLTARQCADLTALSVNAARDLSHPLPLCIGNSAGILRHPAARTNWVRPGIMLYGGSPLLNETAAQWQLQPVMTLTARLIARHELKRGDAVGYGGEFHCPEDMPVGVVAIGYGDGYPRHAPTGTPVLINNQRVQLIGRVSMDMITIDLRQQPNAKIGDSVVLWGAGLPVEEVAGWVGSSNYELLTRLAPRVQLNYDSSSAVNN